MVKILTFDEWVLKMYDYNGNGKIDKAAERRAYQKALNSKNYQTTQQAYAQYVALAEATNKNERDQQNQQAAMEAQQALIEAAGQGNETATAMLTGKTKGDEIKSIVVVGAVALVAVIFLIFRKK